MPCSSLISYSLTARRSACTVVDKRTVRRAFPKSARDRPHPFLLRRLLSFADSNCSLRRACEIRSVDYTKLTGDATRNEVAVTLKPGADPEAVETALQAALPDELRPFVTMARPADLRRFALKLFDRSFAVTYILEAVAILVGLAGVAATMSAQTIARVREFGMLRHLGVEKRQIVVMLGIEGSILGSIGAVAGVFLGLILS